MSFFWIGIVCLALCSFSMFFTIAISLSEDRDVGGITGGSLISLMFLIFSVSSFIAHGAGTLCSTDEFARDVPNGEAFSVLTGKVLPDGKRWAGIVQEGDGDLLGIRLDEEPPKIFTMKNGKPISFPESASKAASCGTTIQADR